MTATLTALEEALRRAGVTDARTDPLTLGMYATDASLYRVPPRAVVSPRDVGEIEATLAVARELGIPITARGAGTSCAGNAVGPGIVIDTARYMGRVLEVDPDSRTALFAFVLLLRMRTALSRRKTQGRPPRAPSTAVLEPAA